ncbi:MAG: Mur ligase family protein, partial [Endomicrobiales bacterium]
EFITGIAFHHFAAKEADIAVLEAGLGGRYDATNVVARPELSIITGIAYDHQEILGRSLKKIAFEKAGIIKPLRPVISGAVQPAARAVIRKAARDNRCVLLELGRDYRCKPGETHWRSGYQRFEYRGRQGKR